MCWFLENDWGVFKKACKETLMESHKNPSSAILSFYSRWKMSFLNEQISYTIDLFWINILKVYNVQMINSQIKNVRN